MHDLSPADFMREYERRTNTHDPEQVAELIAPDAVFWFNDGSFVGLEAIKGALRRTWDTIREERYTVEDLQWIASGDATAVCLYTFRWSGMIDGKQARGLGRGTSVLQRMAGRWQVIHEHLSRMPD